ncbi:MAG TPA: PilZ domain-containing protein [Sphingomicrobium sp.]
MKPREPRRNVMIAARMRTGADWSDACILNMSSKGMLLHSEDAPVRGSYLEIRRGAHIIIGRVVWSKPNRFGIQAQDHIPVDGLVQNSDRSPTTDATATGIVERRAYSRSVQLAHEKSRTIGRLIEFGTFLMVAALATVLVGGVAVEIIFEPMAKAEGALAAR